MPSTGLLHRLGIGAATAALVACSAGGDGTGTRSNEELATSWWSWAASEPDATNPVVDDTGADCARNQPDDVWFLAGNFGGESRRSCTLPADREVFLPVLNAFCSPDDGCVDWFDDAEMEAVLDGEMLELVEIDTGLVEIDGVTGNSVTYEEGTVVAVVAGWWVRLDPLPSGPHRLTVFGRSADGFEVKVQYDLTVDQSTTADA